MDNQYAQAARPGYKLPASSTPIVFAFFMALFMSLFMCMIITAANFGIGGGYVGQVLKVWQIAFPSAFVIVLAIRPAVLKLVKLVVRMA